MDAGIISAPVAVAGTSWGTAIELTLFARRDVHALLGRPAGFASPDELRAHLARWLAAPDDIDRILGLSQSPISLVPHDPLTIGDVEMDDLLVVILTSMGVDPRAAGVLLCVVGDEEFNLQSRTISPSVGFIQDDDVHVHRVSANVELDGINDVATDAGRIELDEAMPETMLAALIGKPVGEAISHPILKDVRARIVDAHHLGGAATRIVLEETGRTRLGDMPDGRRRST